MTFSAQRSTGMGLAGEVERGMRQGDEGEDDMKFGVGGAVSARCDGGGLKSDDCCEWSNCGFSSKLY